MQDGYKNLITYKLARVAFDLVWDFVPRYYWRFEDSRQRDQMKQAIRSHKQGIVEGSSSRSLSSKLNLYGVAQSSGKEIKEDGEDILRLEGLPLWQKDDPRLRKLQAVFEYGSNPPNPSTGAVLAVLGKKLEGKRRMRKEEVEIVANYLVDLLARNGYLLDKQIRAVEEKHRTEGGYRENLLKKRLSFRRLSVFLYFLLLPSIFLLFLPRLAHAAQLSNQFTVELWVNPSGAVASKALLVKNNELRLATDSAGKPLCQIYSGGAWQTAAVSTTVLSLNSWSHVACSYDKSTLKVFLNGVQAGSASLAVALDDSAANFRAGADEGGVYGDLNGLIDDVRIYNYARTQKQILEDMEGGAPGAARMPQPIAHWKFDEGYGTTAHDFVGNNHGIFGAGSSAPSWKNEGKFGKALSFDGGDLVTVTNPSGLPTGSSPHTLSVWIKFSTYGTYGIIGYGNYGTVGQVNALRLKSSPNGFKWYWWGNDLDVNADGLNDNQWHHVLATYNGTRRFLYIDGVLRGSDSPSAPNIQSTDLTIGRTYTSEYFPGLIDEVKIYGYALSEDEVKQDYNQGMAAVMGQSSSSTGSSAPSGSAAQEYCVPGSTDYCAPPVAEWNFEENQGTVARDTSGNGNDGTLVNMDNSNWVVGVNGSGAALRFDGSNEHIISTDIDYGLNNEITVGAWVKFTSCSGNGNNCYIVSKNQYMGNTPYTLAVSGSKLTFAVNNNLITSTQDYNDNNWHYVVGVIKGSTAYLYIDGVLEGSSNVTTTGNNQYVTIGGDDASPTYRPFNGLIDGVKIYKYARTPAQIAWDYNRGAPVGHWRFDECQGTTAHDVSGNENHVTINIGSSAPQTSAGTCSAPTDGTGAWYNGREGRLNSAMSFDGVDDYVAVGNTGRTDIATLSFWAKPASTTQKIIELSASDSVEISAGTVAVTGFGTEKIYIDGVEASSFADANWHHITVVGSAGLTANAMNIGKVGTNYYSGLIDDVRIYNYALTDEQVKLLYNEGAVSFR